MRNGDGILLPRWFTALAIPLIAAIFSWGIWVTWNVFAVQSLVRDVTRNELTASSNDSRVTSHLADPELHYSAINKIKLQIEHLQAILARLETRLDIRFQPRTPERLKE